MTSLRPELVSESKYLSVFLSTIVSLTSTRLWNIIKLDRYKTLEPGMNKFTNVLFSHLVCKGKLYSNLHIVLQAGLTRPGKVRVESDLRVLNLSFSKQILNVNMLNDEHVYNVGVKITVPLKIFLSKFCLKMS